MSEEVPVKKEEIKIQKEDLKALNKKNPKLIFIIGNRDGGMKSKCEKIANDLKLSFVDVHKLVDTQIAEKTKLGDLAQKCREQKEELPADLISNIVLNGIIESKNETILIEGFPRNLNQAFYFEENIHSINRIINFIGKEETCKKNCQEFCSTHGLEFKEEIFKEKYDKRKEELKPLIEFYSKYGIVKEVNADLKETEVTRKFKQSLYPVIYSIIGKRYSGKTELSSLLQERQGITLLDFSVFKTSPKMKKHLNDEEFIINQFIHLLFNIETPRVLIENFPENKAQYSYFINNCKEFERIYYLNALNSTCLERMNNLTIKDPNYTDCNNLTKMLLNFERQADFIHFLKRQTNFLKLKDENGYFIEIKPAPPKPKPKVVEGEEPPKVKKEEPLDLTNKKLVLMEVDVNDHKALTKNKLINMVQPFCLIINCKEDTVENKNKLVTKLLTNYGFEQLDINIVIENARKRNLIPKEGELTSEKKIELLRPLLYREDCSKFILENFPSTLEDVKLFEEQLCEINRLINISKDIVLDNIKDESAIEIYFKNANKFSVLPKVDDFTEFQIKECLNEIRDINIVYGLQGTGKTSMAQHLKNKYNFTLLDFQLLIKDIKKSKADPENPEADVESIEITFDDLLEGLKNYIKNVKPSQRIIIDNIFIPNAAEPFLIDNVEKAKKVLNVIGYFRNLYEITVDEKKMLDKYKAKEGITEELTEDQKAAFEEQHKAPKELLEEMKKISSNVINVKAEDTLEKTKEAFDFVNGMNFIIIKHDYDINIEKQLELFAAKNRLLYINVPKLLYSHFQKHDNYSAKLEASYGKKILKNEIEDSKDNFDGFIYYKYNPIHFESNLVNEIILSYVNERYKEIEGTGNYVLITGYLNYDLLEENNLPFNLPIYELQNVMELGDLTKFIDITKVDIKDTEDEVPVLLEAKKKKRRKKKEGEEGEGEEGEQPPQEGEEANPEGEGEEAEEAEAPEEEDNPDGVPKFKPEGLCWTNYDGVPRNYVQVLKRLKNYDVNVVKSNIDKAGEELCTAIQQHLETFPKRNEPDYKGTISIIKIE